MTDSEKLVLPLAFGLVLALLSVQSCSSSPPVPVAEIPVSERLAIEAAAIREACVEYSALPVEKHLSELDRLCQSPP